MNRKKEIIIWVVGCVVLFVVVAGGVVLALDYYHNSRNDNVNNETSPPSSSEVEVVPPPPVDEKAEALNVQAQNDVKQQKYDDAIKKYGEAKAIYDTAGDAMHTMDLQMQIDLATQQKEVQEKIKNENSGGALAPTGK